MTNNSQIDRTKASTPSATPERRRSLASITNHFIEELQRNRHVLYTQQQHDHTLVLAMPNHYGGIRGVSVEVSATPTDIHPFEFSVQIDDETTPLGYVKSVNIVPMSSDSGEQTGEWKIQEVDSDESDTGEQDDGSKIQEVDSDESDTTDGKTST